MNQRQLVRQKFFDHGACIHANRNEWQLEIIRDPRPSCIAAWKIRNDLRELMPGDDTTINGKKVYRKALTHLPARYNIDGKWYGIDDAIALLEGREVQAA